MDNAILKMFKITGFFILLHGKAQHIGYPKKRTSADPAPRALMSEQIRVYTESEMRSIPLPEAGLSRSTTGRSGVPAPFPAPATGGAANQ